MNENQHGGPAFPVPMTESGHIVAHGMTLRDWFAGQALAGIFKAPDALLWPKTATNIARLAYDCADAMLAARKQP